MITPGYFDVLRIPLRDGRMVEAGDSSALLVNEAFVRHHWGEQNALGRRLLTAGGNPLGTSPVWWRMTVR